MTLALLLTAVGGAWAQGEFSSDPYTSTTEFSSVSVTSSMTLTIKEGVIVTVNSGLTIEDGVTLTLTGGGRLSVYGESGYWGGDAFYEEGNRIVEATAGGDGKPAIILNDNAKIVIDNGEIYAEGGQAGRGGTDEIAGINQPDGVEGNAFSRFPTIDGATLYYKSSDEWFKYTSGDQTLYREMKAVPPTIEVTTNAAEEGATFTEASFVMPTSDVDVNYELVRDMTVDVTAEVGDGSDGYRIRIKKDGNDFVPVNAEEMLISVSDDLDDQHPIDLTVNTDFTSRVQKKGEGDTWTDLSNEDKLSVGTFRYKVTGAGNYTGTIYSNEFQLFEGYEIKVAAGEYATYYKDEALKVEDQEVELLTITAVEDGKVVLSDASDAMPKNTPFLVHNNGTEEKTILLIPCNEPNLAITWADEFIGTLTEKTFTEQEMGAGADFYVCNGKEFIKVRGAGTLAANKAYLKVTGNAPASIPFRRSIDGGEGTTGIDASLVNSEEVNSVWYDLNGRRLQGKPSQKGLYIKNGRKVVVH